MNYRVLPGTDLRMSEIVMGCEPLGGLDWGEFDVREAMDAVGAALDEGVNAFDTSDIYGLGESERNLGKALGSRKGEARVITKFGLVPEIPADGGRAKVHRDASPKRVVEALEASLERLGMEQIALYLLHYPDEKTPFEDTAAALLRCREQGKIGHFGVSNFGAAALDAACEAGPIRALQLQYSLVDRKPEEEIFPAARRHEVGVMAYGPLAQGLLTGKFSADRTFDATDRRHRLPHFSAEGRESLDNLLRTLRDVAEELGRPMAEVAIRWVLERPEIAVAVVGAKSPRQIRQNVAASQWTLPQDLRERLSGAAPTLTTKR